MNAKTLHFAASVSLIALILECVAWEGWLAPLHSGGSVLLFKAVLLLFPLFGVLRGKIYTYQWSSMLILLYFTEGIVRAWSDHGLSSQLAIAEIILSLIFFFSAIFYVRLRLREKAPSSAP